MEYVVGSVAALVSGNVTPSRPKHLKRALTPTKHQPSPNVTPKSELVDRSIFLSPTLQKKKAIAKKSPKRIFENQNLDVTEEDSILASPKADKVKKHLEIELDANTSVNSSLLSPESPKDSAEMRKSPKKLKVMNAAAHVYENTSPKNNKRRLNDESVTKNVESNDASPNKKKKQERKPLSQDAANANQQNGAQSPKKNKKQQQQEKAKPNQVKNIKQQNQVQNAQAKQKPGQQNKNKAEKSIEVQSPKKQNQVQNLQGKQKQKPTLQNNKNKSAQSAEAQNPKKQNQVQKTQAKENQKTVQQNKNKPVEKSVEAQNPKKQYKKKNRKNKKNQNQSVPKPEPKVEEADSEESDEDDDDDENENDDSINPNTSSNIGSDSENDSEDEVEFGSDEDDDDDDDSVNPNSSSNIGSDSENDSDNEESGSDEDDDDEDDDEDDEENDDTVNPNAITNEDSDSEHDSDDEIESENDEANKQALQPEESSDDEEEEVKDTKKNAKKPEKKGKSPKVELTEEQKTEALEDEIKRTIFVGNVPFSKKCKKEIKKIFNEYGTIETIRIRTVPVKDATVTPKLAIIKNELHPERSTVNVYVKFADEASVEKALKANNTVLNGNHLRVHRTGTTGAVHDPKLSVFVGNIPFALEDEGLRAKFEKCGAIESVRIIRDRKTHAGKGFGYVNFESKDGVELALAMSEEDLTIKNRILRVKRCTHTEKKNKDKLPKKFVSNFQNNNKVQGDDGKKNNGAFRRIEMKRKLETRADGPANKRANVNQPRDKKQRKEFVGMTAEKKKKRKFDKGQKKKKVLGEILAKK